MVILRTAAPCQQSAFKTFQSFKQFNPLLYPPPRDPLLCPPPSAGGGIKEGAIEGEEREPALSLSKGGGAR